MKRMLSFVCVLLVLCVAFASAQPVEGKKFEAGAALNLYSLGYSSGGIMASFLYVPLHFGWYLWKGLEIEPEISVNVPLAHTDYIDVTYNLTLNAFYNFKVGRKFIPFIGGGLTFGNGIPYPSGGEIVGGTNLNSSAYNIGAGVKYLLTNYVAIRAEYRYSHFKLDYDESPTTDKYNLHRGLVGVAFFF